MKICVLGFDGGAPQVVFRDERLVNLRRLMDAGVYGLLESVVPPEPVPAWTSFSTSRDPGSLGIYGARERKGYSYTALPAKQTSITKATLWDHLKEKGNKELAVEYSAEFKNIEPYDKNALKDEAFRISHDRWQQLYRSLAEQEWDFLCFVDTGLNRVQHAFWKDFDEKHLRFSPDNPSQNAIPEYYQWLDEQLGAVFELIDDQTIVLVLSAHGAQRLDGEFAINDWLIREGLLVLREHPSTPTPFENLEVDWSRTKAWSEGGSYAKIFCNLQGREPSGVISSEQYDSFLIDLKSRLEGLQDENGSSLQAIIFRPGEIYSQVCNSAPDLLVSLGGLFWRANGEVGHPGVYLRENDGDTCSDSEYGFFILAAPNCPLQGEFDGARLLDMAPTLLDLAGYEIPQSMQGKSLVAGMEKKSANTDPGDGDAQKLIQDRLAGLGYI
jgi:predicted AlkP superfamily phosphohydrolase/phosphomutase